MKTISEEDTQLQELPEIWQSLDYKRTPDDPLLNAPHRNRVTGEVINSDPRTLPEALIAKGVKLEQSRLV
jgi:hypothetical protein